MFLLSFIFIMLSVRQENSKSSCWLNSNPEKNLTNRSMASEDQGLGNGMVAPWSEEDYYCKLKKRIKDKNGLKRSSAVKAMCQHVLQSKKRQIANRVNTINLRITTIASDESRFQWSTVLPKKLSTKLIPHINLPEKTIESTSRLKTQQAPTLETIHRKKSSLRLFPQAKKKPIDVSKHLQDWKDQQYKLNKGHDKKSFIFFFETKNGNRISSREKMVTKIRNLDRGKVERAITCHY